MQDAQRRRRRSARLALLAVASGAIMGGCRAAAPSDGADRLVSVRWELIAIESPRGESLVIPPRPSLVFHLPAPDDDAPVARVSGDGGCNRFWGNYRLLGDGELAFSAIASTSMACEDGRMRLEQLLFVALSAATTYDVTDSVLRIQAADTILRFQAAGPEPVRTDDG